MFTRKGLEKLAEEVKMHDPTNQLDLVAIFYIKNTTDRVHPTHTIIKMPLV